MLPATDRRVAIGLGPLAPDQVIEAGGGRREEAVDMLIAVEEEAS
ncbi:hypothetical protein [Streptomyces cyanogenus]|nr:hypothetical protein [Streptomyces cyanogenus]